MANQDYTPPLMTEQEFNAKVAEWTTGIRMRAANNLSALPKGGGKDWKGRTLPKLKRSLKQRFKEDAGIVNRISFLFSKQGIYLHYGVGRGYIRSGNSVVRGRRHTELEIGELRKRGYSNKDLKNKKVVYKDATGNVMRKPLDWIDVEIKVGIKILANIAQEFYGDKAMKAVLESGKFATIEKKL